MNYSTTEYKNAPVARKINGGSVTMVILTVVVFAAMFVQFAKVI